MKEVAAIWAVTAKVEAALTVPKAIVERKMMELDVTAEFITTVVAAPARVKVPAEQVALLVALISNLFPVCARFKLPFVAVILPSVAVRVVEAVKEPVT